MADVSKQVSGDRGSQPSALETLVKAAVELYAVRPDIVKGAFIGGAIVALALLCPAAPPSPSRRR